MSHIRLDELSECDVPAILAVCEACQEYSVAATGVAAPPAAADSLLSELPDGCCYQDKHILGICDARTRELLGLVDAIVGYPDLRTLTLGLFLIMPQHVGSGVVKQACRLLERWARRRGASRIRVPVYEGLKGAPGFLAQAGFRPTSELVGEGTRKVRVFEKRLIEELVDR